MSSLLQERRKTSKARIAAGVLAPILGGSFGGYTALQIYDYRLGQLEKHEQEDKVHFQAMREELAAIKEKHRLEEGLRCPPVVR